MPLSLVVSAKDKAELNARALLDALQPQLRHLSMQVIAACRDSANLKTNRHFPCTERPDGTLVLGSARDWRSGFYGGMLWMMFEHTRDGFWRDQADHFTQRLDEVKTYGGTHDLGFMIGCSYGNAYRATNYPQYSKVMVEAARTLLTRYNPTVGCIRSWDFNREQWHYPVIIDNMMNLELLFRATELTGDSAFWRVAVSHADKTLQNHFRSDASSYHVIDYNPTTGEVRKRNTAQGFSDDSFWSRGQAWGLYGFTMCYRFTRDPRYLQQARRIARFWLSLKNMPKDGIPYWDMKLPLLTARKEVLAAKAYSGLSPQSGGAGGELIPRDASAAAIVASALIELSGYVPKGEAKRYMRCATHILQSLSSPAYRAPQDSHNGFLLLHSTGHKPNNSEVDVPLIYADYYYMEALMRLAAFQS